MQRYERQRSPVKPDPQGNAQKNVFDKIILNGTIVLFVDTYTHTAAK